MTSSPLPISITPLRQCASCNGQPFLVANSTNYFLPRQPPPPSSFSGLTFSTRRRDISAGFFTSRKVITIPKEENVGEDDAFFALVRRFEEDSRNDKRLEPGLVEALYDDEILEVLGSTARAEIEDKAEDGVDALVCQLEKNLRNDKGFEQKLLEALRDGRLLESSDSTAHDIEDEDEDDDDEEDDDDVVDDDDDEMPIKLKKSQLKSLAYASTSINNLSAEICVDRSDVLNLLKDPPPKLVRSWEDLEKVPTHNWSEKQLKILNNVYSRIMRPPDELIDRIVEVTKVSREHVEKWFKDKRAEERATRARPSSSTI